MSRLRLRAWAAAILVAAVATLARSAELETSPASVVVTAQRGADVLVRARPLDAAGRPAVGVSFLGECSFGRLSIVEETEPGLYTATLSVPPADMPRAVLVVLAPQDRPDLEAVHGIVPVSISTPLAARTEPRSTITATVGDLTFGPAETLRDGSFSLDVRVPPGAESVSVVIRDPVGNTTRSRLGVPSRPHDPLTVVLDRHRVTSDGASQVRVFAYAFGRDGRPVRVEKLDASASVGELSDFVEGPSGMPVATWKPPSDGREGTALLRFTLRHGGSVHEDVEHVRIERGLPAALALVASPLELVAGGESIVSLLASVKDAGGHGIPGHALRLIADRGELSVVEDKGDGTYSASLQVPTSVESGTIEVKALLAIGDPPKLPAQLDVTVDPSEVPTSWKAFSTVAARVVDADGEPVPGEIVLFHVARGEGTVTPAAVTNASGVALADFSADPIAEVVEVEAVSTSVPALRGLASVEKKSTGTFATVSRPALAAQGGRPAGLLVVSPERRVLQDSVLLTLAPGPPARLIATLEPNVLRADGRSTATVIATLLDAHDNPISDETLQFAAGRGTLDEGRPHGDTSVQSTYTAPDGAGDGRDVVTVTHAESGLTASVPLELEVGPAARVALSADPSEIPADGRARSLVTARVEDASGQPVEGLTVSFQVRDSDSRIEPSAITDAAGVARVTLTAGEEPGEAEIVASCEEGPTATAMVELLSLGPVTLELEVDPEVLVADGTTRAELSARVEDAQGSLLADVLVDFELRQGDALLVGTQARSDAFGVARQWLVGRSPGTAIVRARAREATAAWDEVTVALVPGELVASFSVGGPTCAGAVTLTSTSEEAVSWQWDFDGDGAADATGSSVLADLPAGTREIALTITDATARQARAAQSITIRPAPTASVTGPDRVAAGSPASLDASASSAADGSALAFAWDLDADGEHDDASTPRVTWNRPDGRHVARVRVTAASGCSSEAAIAVAFGELPDLEIVKRVVGGAGTVAAGATVEYEIEWANVGVAPAQLVVVRDVLSPHATVSTLPPGGTQGSPGRLTFSLGTLAPGDSGSFRYTAAVASALGAAAVTVTNTATISSATPDADPANDFASVSFAAVEAVDLSVSIAVTAQPAKAGGSLSAALTVRNESSFIARAARLDVEWDPDLLAGPSSSESATWASGSGRLELGDVAPGASRVVGVAWTIAAVLPAEINDVVVRGEVAHSGPDPDSSDDTASASAAVTACPDLRVTLESEAQVDPLVPGTVVTWRMSIANDGTTAATDVRLIHRLDAALLEPVLVANPDGGLLSGAQVEFFLGAIAAGTTRVVQDSVRVASSLPAGAVSLTTEAEVSTVEADCDPANDLARRTLDLAALPDLALEIAVPATTGAGAVLRVQTTVRNDGAAGSLPCSLVHASAGALADVVGASLPAGSSASEGSARIPVPALAAAQSWTVAYDVRLRDPQASVDPRLATTMTLDRAGAADAEAGDESASATTDVAARPDLAIALALDAASAATASAGEPVTAVVTVESRGNAPAPAGTLVLDLSGQPFQDGAFVALPFPAGLPVGSSTTLTRTLRLADVMPGPLTSARVVAVVATPGDSQPANDSATAAIDVTAAIDLAVTMAAPPQAAPGGAFDVDVTVANQGTTRATGVSLTVGADAGAFESVTPASATIGLLAAGASQVERFRVKVLDTLGAGVVSGDVSVAAAAVEPDPDLSDNAASTTIGFTASPDVRLTLTATSIPDPAGADGELRIEALVESIGATTATAPVLTLLRDPALLPLSLRLPAAAAENLATGEITLSFADMPPGTAIIERFVFRIAPALPLATTALVVDGTVTAPIDVDRSNDASTSTTLAGAVSDLVMEPPQVILSEDPLRAGGSGRLVLRARNVGSTTAVAPTVTLTYQPTLVTITSMTGGGVDDGVGTVTWSGLPDLPPLQSISQLEATFDAAGTLPAARNPLSGVAQVTSTTPENANDLPDNDEPWGVEALAEADLCVTVTLTPQPSPAALDGTVVVDVVVRNTGTTAAVPLTAALLHDVADMPSVVDAGGGDASTPGRIEWSAARLDPNATTSFRAVMRLAGSLSSPVQVIEATAIAAAPQVDGCPCGCTGTDSLLLTALPDVSITKTLSASTDTPPRRGTELTFVLSVSNMGSADARDLVVTDELPDEYDVIDPGGATRIGDDLRWDVALLRAGTSIDLTYRVSVDAQLAAGVYRMENRARVTAPEDASTANDLAQHLLDMRLDVDLVTTLTCVASPAPPVPGSRLEWTASVRNRGAGPATGVQLTVVLPPFTSVLDAPPGSGTGPLVIDLGTIGPGVTSAPITFALATTIPLPSAANSIEPTATASCDQQDADPSTDGAACAIVVPAWADLVSTLSVAGERGPAPFDAGELLTFTATVENVGTMTVTDARLVAQHDTALLDFVPGDDFAFAGPLTARAGVLSRGDAPVALVLKLRAKSVLPWTTNRTLPCVTADSSAPEGFWPDNTSCVDVDLQASHDLVATLQVTSAQPAGPGGAISYKAVVTNIGSTAVSGVTLVHERDPVTTTGLTFSTRTGTESGPFITFDMGSIAATGVQTVDYTIGAAAELPALDVSSAATACAQPMLGDAVPANNCAPAAAAIRALPNAWANLACGPADVLAGGLLTCTVTYGSTGASPVVSPVVEVTFPDAVLTPDPSGDLGVPAPPGTLRFTDPPSLAPGSSASHVVALRADSILDLEDTPVAIQATISHAAGAEADPADDSASQASTLRACAELVATLVRTTAAPVPGGLVTYVATWENRGSTAARGATLRVTDSTLVGLEPGQPPSTNNAVFDLQDVDVNETGSQPLTYRVDGVLAAPTNDVVTRIVLASATRDCAPGGETAETRDVVAASPDLALTMSVSSTPATTGPASALQVTLTCGNIGETTSTSSQVVLTFDPALASVTSATGAAVTIDAAAGTVTFDLGTMSPLAPAVTLVVSLLVHDVLPEPSNELVLEAEASCAELEKTLANNGAIDLRILLAAPDLIVSLREVSAAPPSPFARGTVLYEASVENRGSTRATGAGVTASWVPALANLDGSPPNTSQVVFPLGTVQVTVGAPWTGTFTLRLADAYPAMTNPVVITAVAALLESDANAVDNVDSVTTLVGAAPNLVLTTAISPAQPVGAPGVVTYTYDYRNDGSAPAENVWIHAPYVPSLLQFLNGGTSTGTQVDISTGGNLDPARSGRRTSQMLLLDLPPPPTRREIARTARIEELVYLMTRDLVPPDNFAPSNLSACYLDARVESTAGSTLIATICRGSRITLTTYSNPEAGMTYAWRELGGAGTFTSTTAQVTTFEPPTVGGTYQVRVIVTDPASGCSVERGYTVVVDAGCAACGCGNARASVSYVHGSIERADQPGSVTVEAGETVAFRIQIMEGNNRRSAFVLGGVTTMEFRRGGSTYRAVLPGDVYIECSSTMTLVYGAAQVPPAMPPGNYLVSFSFGLDDTVAGPPCGNVTTDTDASNPDNIRVIAPTGAAAPDVDFTDWGPQVVP